MMDASGIKDETGNVETIIPFVLISHYISMKLRVRRITTGSDSFVDPFTVVLHLIYLGNRFPVIKEDMSS